MITAPSAHEHPPKDPRMPFSADCAVSMGDTPPSCKPPVAINCLQEVLGDLARAGICVRVGAGDTLHLEAPRGALTHELRTRVQERKPELLAYLRGRLEAGDEEPTVALWPGTSPRSWPRWRQQVAAWPIEKRSAWALLVKGYQTTFPKAAAGYLAWVDMTGDGPP